MAAQYLPRSMSAMNGQIIHRFKLCFAAKHFFKVTHISQAIFILSVRLDLVYFFQQFTLQTTLISAAYSS